MRLVPMMVLLSSAMVACAVEEPMAGDETVAMEELVELTEAVEDAEISGLSELAADAEAVAESTPAPSDDGGETATSDADLLAEILTAQQAVAHVSGTIRQTTYRTDSPLDEEPGVHRVTFYLVAPDHYHLCFQPENDPEMSDWFIGDGQIQIRAEQMFADEEPNVSATRIVPGEETALARVTRFFRLGQADLERDFTVEASHVVAGAEPAPVSDAAVARVVLTPRPAASSADHMRQVTIELDAEYRTKAVTLVDLQDNTKVFEVVTADYDTEPDPAMFAWPGIDPAAVE